MQACPRAPQSAPQTCNQKCKSASELVNRTRAIFECPEKCWGPVLEKPSHLVWPCSRSSLSSLQTCISRRASTLHSDGALVSTNDNRVINPRTVRCAQTCAGMQEASKNAPRLAHGSSSSRLDMCTLLRNSQVLMQSSYKAQCSEKIRNDLSSSKAWRWVWLGLEYLKGNRPAFSNTTHMHFQNQPESVVERVHTFKLGRLCQGPLIKRYPAKDAALAGNLTGRQRPHAIAESYSNLWLKQCIA
jgi:hypothetical protein